MTDRTTAIVINDSPPRETPQSPLSSSGNNNKRDRDDHCRFVFVVADEIILISTSYLKSLLFCATIFFFIHV